MADFKLQLKALYKLAHVADSEGNISDSKLKRIACFSSYHSTPIQQSSLIYIYAKFEVLCTKGNHEKLYSAFLV